LLSFFVFIFSPLASAKKKTRGAFSGCKVLWWYTASCCC